jgi:predicted AlkP superfamily phosphohydrolase/phosphomutase
MIVLGIDGMDPGFLERHWVSLPNLRALAAEGEFKRLGTTMPPQSPVAWSTFITGLEPAGHGIWDFIHRDPDTMLPLSSMARTHPGRQLHIGPYLLPLTGGRVENLRHGKPFWSILSEHGVPVTILRMPTDFPPFDCGGHALAGMGTPDLRGTFGTFAFFTDDEQWKDRKLSGGEVSVVRLKNHHATLRLPGPANTLRTTQPATHTEIDVHVDPEKPVARFEIGGRRIVLMQGEWSDWIPVQFPLISHVASAEGMVRIYAKELQPGFAVYVSPINIDPAAPAMPVSAPESYSAALSDKIGRFYTQGMPYDTAALRHGVLTRKEYLAHSRHVSEQTLKVLHAGLDELQDGLLFFHFFGIDQDSHMLWGRHDEELLETYKMVDAMLGQVRRKAGDAALIVLSDHGFASFDRAVHLNSWLRREGFLALKVSKPGSAAEALANVDWPRTKAYSIGLNAIYVNQQFRERDGIVAEGEEVERTVEAVRKRLLAFRDPANGNQAVRSVAASRTDESMQPDLIVGYAPGYRSSWQTALGGVPDALIEDNTDEWRADHCIDPRFVEGVLLSNRKIATIDPRLADLPVTILRHFDAAEPETMQGRDLFVSKPE